MKERYLIKFLLRDNATPCTGSEENWDIECALMVRDIADMASPCRNILLSLNMQSALALGWDPPLKVLAITDEYVDMDGEWRENGLLP